MRTHVRYRSGGSRRAINRKRQAALDLLVLKGQALRSPAERESKRYSGRELESMTGEAAALGRAILPASAMIGTIIPIMSHGLYGDCLDIGENRSVLVSRRSVGMRMHGRDLNGPSRLRRGRTRHAGGEDRQADRDHRDENGPQQVQGLARRSRQQGMSHRTVAKSKLRRATCLVSTAAPSQLFG